MTPKVKIFEIVFPGFLDGTPNYVSWPNLVKIGRCELAKLSKGRVDYHTQKTRPSPHFAKNGLITPKIPWTLSPLDVSTYTELARIGCFCRTYSGKIDFSAQKVTTVYMVSAYNDDEVCSCLMFIAINYSVLIFCRDQCSNLTYLLCITWH